MIQINKISLFSFSTQPNILTLTRLVPRAPGSNSLPVQFSSNHNFHNERWKVEAGRSKGGGAGDRKPRFVQPLNLLSFDSAHGAAPRQTRAITSACLGRRYVSPGPLLLLLLLFPIPSRYLLLPSLSRRYSNEIFRESMRQYLFDDRYFSNLFIIL